MARNDMYYPPYYNPMQRPISLLHCSGASGATEMKLPPESTAAVFDDQTDRVYIVTNEGDFMGKSRIKYTFDLVKIPTPNDGRNLFFGLATHPEHRDFVSRQRR